MILEDNDLIGFSEPTFLDERTFMITYIIKRPLPEAYIQLYELDPTNASQTPREIRKFHLPAIKPNFSLELADCVSRAMSPTYTGVRSRSETLTAKSIYADHEQLCHIILAFYEPGHDTMQQYSFFAYPSSLMSKAYVDNKDIAWESWGYKNASISENAAGPSPMWAQWYSRGDRVAVVTRTSRVPPVMYNWTLRVLDFRPARVRRAQLVDQRQNVWPPPREQLTRATLGPVQENDSHRRHGLPYAFQQELVPYNLPFIETTVLENIVCANIEVEMDDRRIVLNQVSFHTKTFDKAFSLSGDTGIR
jgi:hypothetical protein